MRPSFLLPVCAFLTVSFTAFSADTPNFTGEWKMNAARSNFGPVPAPDLLTRSIKHDDPSLQITTHQKGARGESTSELNYTTDGKPAANKVQALDSKGTARWEGDKLVIESWLEIQGAEIRGKEVWSLSGDGKTLTIKNHTSLPKQGDFDTTLVLEKQ